MPTPKERQVQRRLGRGWGAGQKRGGRRVIHSLGRIPCEFIGRRAPRGSALHPESTIPEKRPVPHTRRPVAQRLVPEQNHRSGQAPLAVADPSQQAGDLGPQRDRFPRGIRGFAPAVFVKKNVAKRAARQACSGQACWLPSLRAHWAMIGASTTRNPPAEKGTPALCQSRFAEREKIVDTTKSPSRIIRLDDGPALYGSIFAAAV